MQDAISGFGQGAAHGTHFIARCLDRLGRKVRQRVIVLMNTGVRRRHGTPPVEILEELVEGSAAGRDGALRRGEGVVRAHDTRSASSGNETQRRSRNDCSTALMTSCTRAPSVKSASFRSSLASSSVMKDEMRLA